MRAFIIFFITTLGVFIAGCQTGPAGTGGGEVELRVTTDYGQEIIFSETVEVRSGESVLSVLEEHLKVEYAYGGRFINSIEGISSGYTGIRSGSEKNDWFFYMNGILCGAGAGDYYPQQGDAIWWDYSSWDGSLFVPAVTGAFPRPFVSGFGGQNPGTLILYGKNNEGQAGLMKQFLKENGAVDVELMPYREEHAANRSRITMVIAPWRELAGDPFWQGLQEHRSRSGWFAEFDGGHNIIPLDENGEKPANTSGADGAVLATGSGMGDRHPLWLVTAADEEKMGTLISLITESTGSIAGTVGVVMVNHELIPLPAAE